MLETKMEANLSQAEVAAAERVQKKSAIALSRLVFVTTPHYKTIIKP